MTVVTGEINVQSRGNCETIDITPQVAKNVQESGVNSGIATLFITGSTAGITTIEYEPNLVTDFRNTWDRLVPEDISYEHDKTWGDGNGHSHVRASMLGPSLVIPFVNKRLALGTWQQVVLVDFDNRSRSRRVLVQILGE